MYLQCFNIILCVDLFFLVFLTIAQKHHQITKKNSEKVILYKISNFKKSSKAVIFDQNFGKYDTMMIWGRDYNDKHGKK